MGLRGESIESWPAERIAEALPSIIACARRIVAEHPDELTLASLYQAVASGQSLLWVVFDEDAPNVAVLTVYTTLRHYEATGINFVEITGIAGDRITEALPLLDQIEDWAAANNAAKIVVKGRAGWGKLLKERGYSMTAAVLAKAI